MRSHPLIQPTTPKNKTTNNVAALFGLPFLLRIHIYKFCYTEIINIKAIKSRPPYVFAYGTELSFGFKF
jgi:hypothetical protein